MTEKNYAAVRKYFLAHEKAYFFLKIVYKYFSWMIIIAYPTILLMLFIGMLNGGSREDFVKFLLVPAGVFLSMSVFRLIINNPRPYEALDISPLIKKDTKGKSFPSRHTTSIFIISMACNYINPVLGAFMFVFAVLISASPFFAGVHYIRDIVAAIVYSLTVGAAGFYIL